MLDNKKIEQIRNRINNYITDGTITKDNNREYTIY